MTKPKKNRTWLYLGGGVLLLSLVLGVGIGVGLGGGGRGKKEESSSTNNNNALCVEGVGRVRRQLQEDGMYDLVEEEEELEDREYPRRRQLQFRNDDDIAFEAIGCFRTEFSADRHVLDPTWSESEMAMDCSTRCSTLHFAVTQPITASVTNNDEDEESTTTTVIVNPICYCYVDAPTERLAIGSCNSVCDPSVDRMETYFKKAVFGTECNQDASRSVRNFLVEEDDVPFGYDIVRNTYKSSPFELYKDECGTNIYEVQTEFSENGSELTTTVQKVTEYAQETKSHLSNSIKGSAKVKYNGLLYKAAVSVSAAYDTEQNALFQSSGANSQQSRVYTSLGVKRLAEVVIRNFDSKRYFVTLNPEFASLLRSYKASGYDSSIGKDIINTYGMFIVTRGIFGGYIQIRSTATDSDISSYFATEEDSRKCYEAAMSASASGFGFSGSVSVETSGCSAQALQSMQQLQEQYASETTNKYVYGGQIVNNQLVVTPQYSRLLTTRDKYPENDSGIELRLLSDFLTPEKISPLEIRRYQLVENDFIDIQTNLEKHILEELESIQNQLLDCSTCDFPYLIQGDSTEGLFDGCTCYAPTNSVSFTTEISTPNQYRYYTIDHPLTESASKCIIVDVVTPNDVHIGFFHDPPSNDVNWGIGQKFYEIVIGGWNDSTSVLRNVGQGDNLVRQGSSSANGWLDGNSIANTFWACANLNNQVQCGQGDTIGENAIMAMDVVADTDDTAYDIHYAAISTGFGASGSWSVRVLQ